MADQYYLDSVSDNPEYFRNCLLELDSHIDSDTLVDLKFLLRDFVPGVALERIDCGRDLFSHLEKQGQLSDENRSLLAECLWRAGLGGYLYLLDQNPRHVQQQVDTLGRSSLSPYRRLMYSLSSELSGEDVKRLLYQLSVKKAKADSLSTGPDLFVYLEKQGLIGPDNLDLIANAFHVLGRLDLKEMVDDYLEATSMLQGPASQLPSLGPSQPPSYRFQPPSYSAISGPSKGSNPSRGDESVPPVVTTSHQDPRAGSVWGGGDKLPAQSSAGGWRSDSALPRHQPPPEPMTSLRANAAGPSGSRPDPGSEENQPMSMREAQVSMEPERGSDVSDSLSAQAGGEPAVANLNTAPAPTDLDDDYYPMTHSPRGLCLIINNETFQKPPANSPDMPNLSDRVGSEVDATQLERVWKKLDFEVIRKDNLTAEQMGQTLINLAVNTNHSQYDCFVCCVLSHGIKDHIYGVDLVAVPIPELLAPFKPFVCPTMRGKPKLFFMQACQGKDKQGGTEIDEDSPYAEGSARDPAARARTQELVPNEADFLLGFATVPGYVSYRSRSRGSWYITKLVEMLEKHGTSKDILTILTQVNREVGRAIASFPDAPGPYKQSPAPLFTLRKKLQFFPLQPTMRSPAQ